MVAFSESLQIKLKVWTKPANCIIQWPTEPGCLILLLAAELLSGWYSAKVRLQMLPFSPVTAHACPPPHLHATWRIWKSWSDWKPAQPKKEVVRLHLNYFPREARLLLAQTPAAREQRGAEQHGKRCVAPPGQKTGPQQPGLNLTSAAALKLHWKGCRTIIGLYKNMKGRSLAQESISQKGLLGKKFGCCFCGLQVLTENYITSFGLYKSTLKK